MFADGVFTATWDRLTRLWDTPDTAPRVEPVTPPADVLAAMSAPVDPDPPAACDLRPPATELRPIVGYRGQIERAECDLLDRLADRIAGGMSPLAAAQAAFGGPR